jgi:uroporphyrin-III C-methyltransferase
MNNTPPVPVYIVGAGPGDPALLTVEARMLLNEATVVLHDSLVSDAILETISDRTVIIDVGKRPGDSGTQWSQSDINKEMAARARAGEAVVRLKGGDPTVFARGGEEAQYLATEGIPFDIVPGITSAIGAPALAGIFLTHRNHASSLTIITGHEDPSKSESALDWAAIADSIRAGGTLVILMGIGRVERNISTLCSKGVDETTPIAFIERAGWVSGSVTIATVETAVEVCQNGAIEPPTAMVIGEVVSIRNDIEEYLLSSVRGGSSVLEQGDERSAATREEADPGGIDFQGLSNP